MKNSTKIALILLCSVVFMAAIEFFYLYWPDRSVLYFPAFATVVLVLAIIAGICGGYLLYDAIRDIWHNIFPRKGK